MSAQSDVILGEGMSRQGVDASLISPDAQGLGLLMGEEGKNAQRFRAFFLTDDHLRDLAARAETFRTGDLVADLGAADEVTGDLDAAVSAWGIEPAEPIAPHLLIAPPGAVVSGCALHLGGPPSEALACRECLLLEDDEEAPK